MEVVHLYICLASMLAPRAYSLEITPSFVDFGEHLG
jgi:hypothetical protein